MPVAKSFKGDVEASGLVKAGGQILSAGLVGTRAARPTAAVAGNGALYYATDNGITYRSDGAAWTAIGWEQLRVTSLPASPAPEDGQRIVYVADSGNGVLWPLRYNAGSASSFKWEADGTGMPLRAETATSQTTASTSYVSLATAGPSITLPLAGDYDITPSADMSNNASPQNCAMSYSIGATAAIDNDAAWSVLTSPTFLHTQSSAKTHRKTGLAASAAVLGRYRVSGGTGTFAMRQLEVLPVRVG